MPEEVAARVNEIVKALERDVGPSVYPGVRNIS